MSKQEQSKRLYQAVERLALQAGEDTDETIDWLCGEHGGMAKLFEKFFSPTMQHPREWVGLNWDDLPEIYVGDTTFLHGAKWAEAKLKEKNT